MALGTPATRLVSATVQGGAIRSQSVAGTANNLITGVFVKSCAPELSLVGVTMPTTAAGAATLSWKASGPSSQNYPVVLNVVEVATA